MVERLEINAHIGELISSDVAKSAGSYYVVNTLVPERDGSRIIGPLDWDGLENKREMYDGLTKKMSGNEAARYPFIVYHFGRTFVQIE